jgi:hypothetical protein
MGRLRSFFKRAAKPAAMTAVAGMLALSLTVTTTQKAEAAPIAVAPVIVAAEAIVGGASLPLVMPSVLATSLALHPVGWAIAGGVAAAGLAVGAYYTKDYWLPWVMDPLGSWGKATGGNPSGPAPAGAHTLAGFTTTGVTKENATDWAITATVPPGTSDYWLSTYAQLSCKDPTSGAIRKFQRSVAFAYGKGGGARSWSVYCGTSPSSGGTRTNETMVGLIVGAPGSDPVFPGYCAGATVSSACFNRGPENLYKWGDQLGTSSPAFDPKGSDVKYRTTVECIEDNGNKTTITADWLGSDGGAKYPSCAAAGKGHATGVTTIEGTKPGTITPEKLWETTAPAVDPNYDKCGPERPGSGCKMAITLDGKPCVSGNFVCENWSEFKNDAEWGPRLGCTYGPYTLTLEQCSIMEPAYKPGGAPATEENADGNPNTKNYTEPGGNTFTPTQTAPAPVPGGAGAPQPSQLTELQCWPQGWGVFNPADWIAKPLRCAFEPKKDFTAVTTALATKAETKAPIGFLVMDMGGPDSAGCPDWTINVAGLSKNVVCGASFTDAIHSVRAPLFGLLATAMVWPLLRSMWYAAIPILRVTPSDGGK